ncbi:conserved hypothetical protein [Rhizophagus irregularis DAOM 181602=DAOM 197198]|nr:conserved hypothetical protein [Rhizophagus irregularis DAOM 181602=DAOM 197198]
MVALVPFIPSPPPAFQLTINAARQLIAEQRNLHQQFKRIANCHHVNIWTIIANRVFAATGFAATSRQCSTKWNTLKRGYENLNCEGKEGGRNLGLDQKVEIEVEIEDETEVEIEDEIEVEIEEEVEAGSHIEDKDIKF